MCKVKYKRAICITSLKDKIHIELLKLILVIKRCWRRTRILVLDNSLLFMLLTFAWAIFVLVVYVWGSYYYKEKVYTPLDIIWDFKGSYFTSVVLSVFINSYNKVISYKSKIKNQYSFYWKTMECFSKLYGHFIGEHKNQYIVFYCDKCVSATSEYIEALKNIDLDKTEFLLSINDVLEQLDKVEREVRNGNVIGAHQDIKWHIDSGKENMKKLREHQMSNEQIAKAMLYSLYDFQYIVSDLRRPWKWDKDIDIHILNILDKYEENDIRGDFYDGMLIRGYQF